MMLRFILDMTLAIVLCTFSILSDLLCIYVVPRRGSYPSSQL